MRVFYLKLFYIFFIDWRGCDGFVLAYLGLTLSTYDFASAFWLSNNKFMITR